MMRSPPREKERTWATLGLQCDSDAAELVDENIFTFWAAAIGTTSFSDSLQPC
jgi:hypothetical protein